MATFKRQLSADFVSYLQRSNLWRNICTDRELQPEIRNGAITVYFCGRALLRELKLEAGSLSASVHHNFVPLRRSKPTSIYLELRSGDEGGLEFVDRLSPEAIHHALPATISAYKRLMKFEAGPEDLVQHRIAINADNCVVDQQIEFPGDTHNKLDLCFFDPFTRKLFFAEIKRCDDVRLLDRNGETKVLRQLAAYGDWLNKDAPAIAKTYRRVIELKRALGLGERLALAPDDDLKILTKPVLVVGNCSRTDVQQFRRLSQVTADPVWTPLWSRLPEVASRLILVGKDGCTLSRRDNSSQHYWFD